MYLLQEKRDEEIGGELSDEIQNFVSFVPRYLSLFLKWFSIKKELRARKSTNLSFLRLSQRWPILFAVIGLVVHVVAGVQEWLESLLAGPGGSSSWPSVGKDID